MSIRDQVCKFTLLSLAISRRRTDTFCAMLQSSRCAEERAELHHERSTRVLNSGFHRRQIGRIVRQAAGTRSSLLRARCRLRGIDILPIDTEIIQWTEFSKIDSNYLIN